MAVFIQGYDEDRFVSKVDPNFLCLICRSVLKDAVLCPRNHHCFCRVCIRKHLVHSKKCPTCSDELNGEALTEPQNTLKRILNGLEIHCIYIDRGCQEILQLQHLERHEATCGFMPVVCSNQGCDVTVNQRDRIHHESEVCEFRKVKCHSCEEMSRTLAEMGRRVERMERNFAVMERNVTTKVSDIEKTVVTNLKKMEQNVATKASENTELVTRLDTAVVKMNDILVKVNKIEENQRKRRRTGNGDREDTVARSSESFNRRPEKYGRK